MSAIGAFNPTRWEELAVMKRKLFQKSHHRENVCFWGKADMTLPGLSPAIRGKPMHGTSSFARICRKYEE
jgi:hypothetical protein